MNRFLVFLMLLCMTGTVNLLYAQDTADTSVAALASQAYSLLDEDPDAAELLFLYISHRNPEDVTIKRQLGYIYHQKNDYVKALDYFTAAESLSQSDTISLNIAYCLASLNRPAEAEKILNRLQSSQYPAIRESARRQRDEISGAGKPSHWWTRIYADPYYDTRWNSWFYYADIQQGYAIDAGGIFNGYAFLNVSGDSRSMGELAPEIFSDNAAITGLGVSIRPFRGLQFNTQYGLSYDFIKREDKSRIAGDFRSLIIYSDGIYPSLNLHDDVRIPLSPLLDVYSSLGYYSRYKNFIGYLQARAGARFFEVGYTAADIYLKGSLVRDTEKEFYNNQLSGAVGIRVVPNVTWGLYLAAEFHRGYYWDVGTTYNPYDSYFSSFRFFIIFERTF